MPTTVSRPAERVRQRSRQAILSPFPAGAVPLLWMTSPARRPLSRCFAPDLLNGRSCNRCWSQLSPVMLHREQVERTRDVPPIATTATRGGSPAGSTSGNQRVVINRFSFGTRRTITFAVCVECRTWRSAKSADLRPKQPTIGATVIAYHENCLDQSTASESDGDSLRCRWRFAGSRQNNGTGGAMSWKRHRDQRFARGVPTMLSSEPIISSSGTWALSTTPYTSSFRGRAIPDPRSDHQVASQPIYNCTRTLRSMVLAHHGIGFHMYKF